MPHIFLYNIFFLYSLIWICNCCHTFHIICNSLHHIMPMFSCVMILVSLLTRYPQFPQGYPQNNAICCTSIVQKIWNVAIFSITNGNKKNGNIFPPPQNRRFLKNFSTRLQQSSCQIHLNHTGVCLWCFVKPPQGEHCVFLWGLPCVVDSHKHVTCLCARK